MGNVSVRDYHPIYDSEMFVSMYPTNRYLEKLVSCGINQLYEKASINFNIL